VKTHSLAGVRKKGQLEVATDEMSSSSSLHVECKHRTRRFSFNDREVAVHEDVVHPTSGAGNDADSGVYDVRIWCF
jgi:hypothetical protein